MSPDARYVVTIKDDLEFLGIAWEGEVMVQSGRMALSRRLTASIARADLSLLSEQTTTRQPARCTHPRNTDQLATAGTCVSTRDR